MIHAIEDRRSIRKYQTRPVPRCLLEEIIRAGTLAPSSKNRQPWKFVVVSGQAKADMLRAMEQGLDREKHMPLLPDSACHLPGAEHTLRIMTQAPVAILVLNRLGQSLEIPLTPEERVYERCNAQSIGAAMQNMTLAATELGLGSLWICDTYFAQRELQNWLNEEGDLFAALAIGFPDEQPMPRPRRAISETVEWRES